jgi:hypothetical protein
LIPFRTLIRYFFLQTTSMHTMQTLYYWMSSQFETL